MQFEKEKFSTLVQYICRKYATEPKKLGKTKLHKILWMSDIWHYRQYGDPITGAKYIKMKFGPFAEALDETLADLQKQNKLYMNKIEIGDMEKFDLIGKGTPDMSSFNDKEMLTINDVSEYVAENHTAASISDKTHDEIWKMAILYEEIPYEAMIARPAKITEEHVEWAKKALGLN